MSWNTDELIEFDKERGKQCAHTTGIMTRWIVEML